MAARGAAAVLAAVFVSCGGPAGAQCTGRGPCGPVGLEWAVPQGFAGADFRPTCAAHDLCYSTPGVSRKTCDRRFRRGLVNSCRNSRRPILCRLTANTMFVMTRLFGRPAFRASRRG